MSRADWADHLRAMQPDLDLGLPVVPEQSEADVQRAILAVLRRHPGVAWVDRRNSGVVVTRLGHRLQLCAEGTTDLEGMTRRGETSTPGQVLPGRFFGIEVKAAKGRVANAQRARIEQIRQLGHLAGVARSVADALAIVGGEELD